MRDKLAPGHNFVVFIGPLMMSFAKITGIDCELYVENIREGGRNDQMISLYTPKTNMGRLVFEHGTGYYHAVNKNFRMAEMGLYLSMPTTIVSYADHQIKRIYGYSGGVPVKWSLSELNAQNGSILIDSIEVLHQGISEIPLGL